MHFKSCNNFFKYCYGFICSTLRIIGSVTYGEFLERCRELMGIREKAEISKSEFARRLGFKKPAHYIGASNDKRVPGRELLEKAAELAGFKFEDCISIPVELPKTTEEKRAIAEFADSIGDHRHDAAILAAMTLKGMRGGKANKRR